MRRHLLPALVLLAACQRTHTVGEDDIGGIAEGGGSGEAGDEDEEDEDDGGSGSGSSGSGSGSGSSGSSSGSGSSGSGSGTDDCWTEIWPDSPAPGAADHYYRSPIDVLLYGGYGTETLQVFAADGAEVPGTTTNDGWAMSFTPTAPLVPDSDYTVLIEFCEGELAEYAFSTSDIGAPVSDCDPAAAHYVLDLAGARFVEPAGLAELFVDFLEGEPLLSVADPDGSPGIVFGYGDGSDAETCSTASGLDGTWSNPHIEASGDLPVRALETDLTLYGATIGGDVSPDCTRFGGGTISGRLDVREMGDMMGDLLGITDPDEICATFTGFGISCTGCPDGDNYCMDVAVEQVDGTARGTAQTPITADEVLALPECEAVSGSCSTLPADRALGLVGLSLLGLALARRRTRA